MPDVNPFSQLDVHLKIPDLWQQEALHYLREGLDVVVSAPTGAGKTYLVELMADRRRTGQIVLAVPTRALANDKLREFRSMGWRVGIVTGDVTIDPEAPLVVATLETQKPRFLEGVGPSLFVIDEYQMIGDPTRGVNYELCVALAPPETQLLLLSGSVSNPEDMVSWLERIGRQARLVSLDQRPVPLEEAHIDALSQFPPKSITGFWPRLLAKALMADLGPILVFSPQRKGAEKLAKQLAGALPLENPLALSPAQKRLAGAALERLLVKRIAYHHSGLSYQQRAGLIEPLAKAGQLRIVVATTGLAAGVNFSMRSVLVTDSQFTVGHVQQLIRPDELLQMFGRAGRRGLDTIGYALAAPDRPRLREGKTRPIRRPKLLDWPSLVSIMAAAHDRGDQPFEAVVDASERLFNETPVEIGVEHCLANPQAPCGLMIDAERARFAQPESEEILNSRGDWEPRGELQSVKAGEAFVRSMGRLRPALQCEEFARERGGGRPTRIKAEGGGSRWGKKMALGFRDKGKSDVVQTASWLREACGRAGKSLEKRVELGQLETLGLGEVLGAGQLVALKWERHRLVGRFDLESLEVPADIDLFGVPLIEPETRKAYTVVCQNCPQHPVCEGSLSRARSPALAWRQLALIDENGAPTRRGRVFSFFQGGEGLAVAAALEEDAYSVDAVAHDIANLRAGYRFDEYSQYSHRLARACRVAYGDRTYEGYLKHGLPPQYGEGAAEVIAEWRESSGKGRALLGEELRFGDVQRARLEWLSLLRRIAQGPDFDWERWQELQQAARAILDEGDPGLYLEELPPLEPSQTTRISHRLRFARGW